MKQGKRTTRKQRELLSKHGYDWTEWLFHTEDDLAYCFVSKKGNEIIWVSKE